MKDYTLKGILIIFFAMCVLIFLASIVMKPSQVRADESLQDILDEKIERFCMEHEGADEKYFEQTHGQRCTLIGQAQYRFETKGCTIGSANVNNCFGLKRQSFIEFENKTDSIIFWVNRYYKYEKYKTIGQIIKGGYYCSPETGNCFFLQGYTTTIEHQKNYYAFVKDYFNNN